MFAQLVHLERRMLMVMTTRLATIRNATKFIALPTNELCTMFAQPVQRERRIPLMTTHLDQTRIATQSSVPLTNAWWTMLVQRALQEK
jgi:hypothetical protein